MTGGAAAPRWQVVTGLLVVYVVWGSTYLAIRVMVETMPPLLGAGARFALAGAVMLGVLTIRRRRGFAVARITGRELASAVVVGTLLCFLGNGLVTVAEQHVPSGLAALLVGSVPMWVVLLRSATGDRVLPGTLGGVAVGFGGLALLLLPGSRPAGAALGSALLVVFAAACWASGSFLSTRVPLPRAALQSTGWQMLGGGMTMTVTGLVAGEGGSVDFGTFSTRSLLAFAYLVLIGSLVAFSAYAWLLQHAPISLVATYAYVNPVVAVLLGWLILDEQITVTTAVGATVVVASVWWIVRARPAGGAARAAPAPPAEDAAEATPARGTTARSVL